MKSPILITIGIKNSEQVTEIISHLLESLKLTLEVTEEFVTYFEHNAINLAPSENSVSRSVLIVFSNYCCTRARYPHNITPTLTVSLKERTTVITLA